VSVTDEVQCAGKLASRATGILVVNDGDFGFPWELADSFHFSQCLSAPGTARSVVHLLNAIKVSALFVLSIHYSAEYLRGQRPLTVIKRHTKPRITPSQKIFALPIK
jgi:hypothetical protein